jgi:hypothetical protein
MKDINTYRFRRANFQDVWETNFLLAAIPIFLDMLKSVVFLEKNKELKDLKKFNLFDHYFETVIKTLNSL